WLFRPPSAVGQPYLRPPGLTLNLVRTLDGFQTVDAKRRISTFDSLGRLTTESDEFGTSGVTGKGNTIRYLYDLTGRLKTIVDPVGRATTLTYSQDSKPKVTDALKQERTYTLTAAPADSFSDRVHVFEMVVSVPVAAINGTPVGVAKLPSLLGPGVVSGAPQQRKFAFTHPDGMLKTTT